MGFINKMITFAPDKNTRPAYWLVGITDLQGNPYVIPMNFAYRDGVIYLHSGPDGGKLEMVKQHPQVCITFCEGHELVYMHRQMACSYSMKSRSVMCRGNVRFIEEMDEKRNILDLVMRHYVDYEFKYGDRPAAKRAIALFAPSKWVFIEGIQQRREIAFACVGQ